MRAMRHSALRFVALAVLAALAGCTASGSDSQAHGPVYEPNEAGGTDAAGGPDVLTDSTPPNDAGIDATQPPLDAGGDAPADTNLPPGDSGSCTDTTAIVAGNASAFYKALAVGTGAFTVASDGAPTLSPPSIVAAAGGFVAVVRTGSDLLDYTVMTGGTWSPLHQVAGATTPHTPALSAIGANVHAIYLGVNGKYYHGTYSGGAWDAASDAVGGVAAQSFGPTPVGLTAVGTSLLFAHRGGTSAQLYWEGWAGGAWSAGPIGAAQVTATPVSVPVPPTAIALTGGASDAMIVYLHDVDVRISWATRSANTWTDHGSIDAALFSNDPVAVAALPGGKAVLVYRGSDSKAYASVYNGTAWSLPATALGVQSLGGPPAIAPGACGDDAIAVLPVNGGDAAVVRLVNGAWTSPTTLAGATNATGAAVATSK